MTTVGERFLAGVAVGLRGPRRHRRRLLEELAAHLDDAVRAELDAGAGRVDAEAIALERLGDADAIARSWNGHRRALRGARRRRLAAVAFACVAACALGVTQYAAGKPNPAPPRSCVADAASGRAREAGEGGQPAKVAACEQPAKR